MTDPTTPVPNIPLLRKAVEWVEAEAAKPVRECQWSQADWVTPAARIGRDCGTCYCVAGYVGQLLDPRYEHAGWTGGGSAHVSSFAAQALGLTQSQTYDLFDATNSAFDVRRIAEDIAGGPL